MNNTDTAKNKNKGENRKKRAAVMFSGGKDSVFAAYTATKNNIEIAYLVSFYSENPESYMFHYPNIELTELAAQSMGITHIIKQTEGKKEEELSDIKEILQYLDIDCLVTGALASKYQHSRLENICKELNIECISPLWGENPADYMLEFTKKEWDVRIVGVAAEGLDKPWLGRKIDEKCVNDLLKLNEKTKIHVAGEGGEFETLVLDCPFFSKKIEILESKTKWTGQQGTLEITKARLVGKKSG
ncbi:MAG: TIGR00289 family protein [Candidatus Diapherotrites archaeon]|nr:TIGR00289 family protein [Candidatus Diapherotrites archaeon]